MSPQDILYEEFPLQEYHKAGQEGRLGMRWLHCLKSRFLGGIV